MSDVVIRSLRRAGFKVTAAAAAEEALSVFERAEDNIDVVVTDIVMPGLYGDVLAERLTSSGRDDLRILFVSGYTDEVPRPLRNDNPYRSFLAKPFTPEELIAAVGELLETRGAEVEAD